MYTRCPECQTAFRIIISQLKARDGLVRCGRCDSIFRADLHLFAAPAAGGAPESGAAVDFAVASELNDIGGADALAAHAKEIPVITDLSIFQAPRRGIPNAVWALGALPLTLLLLGQFAYFYRNELAQVPALHPRLAQFCEFMRCELAPPDAMLPELVETRIAPHPRYANALRIRATLANRAERAQTLPLMQVSLTDNGGQLLARRTFTPRQYLQAGHAGATLAPNVVVSGLLDVTNPDGKAAGYEVRLVPQQSARAP